MAEPQFASEFGDVTLVLADGSLHYYRALLALVSPWWGALLQGAPLSSLVLLPGHTREQLVREIAGEGEGVGQGEDVGVTSEDVVEVKQEIDSDLESFDTEETKPIAEFNMSVDKKDTRSVLVDLIQSDFSWPRELGGQNFHRMRWREAKGAVLEVRGNLSLWTTLRRRLPDLPESAAFSVRHSELVGRVNLRHLVDGQAFTSQPAFSLDGRGAEVSLQELLGASRGLETSQTDPYSLINIYYGDTEATLQQLTDQWKTLLAASWEEGEKVAGDGTKVSALLAWMRDRAPTGAGGGLVCAYCGHVCQNGKRESAQTIDGFRSHMINEHLYASRKSTISQICKICDISVKGYVSAHMKRVHEEEYKPRILTCPLCDSQVLNLKQHCREEHMEQKWTCHICTSNGKTFTDPNKFRTHLQVHAREDEKKTSGSCNICGNNKHYNDLYKHQQTKHQVRVYYCDHCDRTFNFIRHLKRHKQRIDGTQKRRQCPECSNSYINITDHIKRFHRKLQRIQQIKKYASLPAIQCKICNQEFKGKRLGLFNPHLREKHIPVMLEELGIETSIITNDGKEKDEIGQIFAKSKSVWISSEQVDCLLCNRSCANKSQMVTHMRRHLGFTHRMGGIIEGSNICHNWNFQIFCPFHSCSRMFIPGISTLLESGKNITICLRKPVLNHHLVTTKF